MGTPLPPDGDGDIDDDAGSVWVGTARRAGWMQMAQLALMVACAAAAIAATVITSRSLAQVRHEQRAHQAVLGALYDMRDRMKSSKLEYVEAAASGAATGLPGGVRVGAQAAPLIISGIAARDVAIDAAENPARDALVRDATTVAALVGGFPPDGSLTGAEGRRFTGTLSVIGERMLLAADAWISRKDRELLAAAAAAEAAASRQRTFLIGFFGVLLVVGLGIWGWLGRARARFLRAIQEAQSRLADRAVRDQLTGLPGHASFQQRLVEEFDRARAEGGDLALVLIDIDHFKQVNDAFGHPVGDRVLRRVARLMWEKARQGECVARVGGEEFAWLLPGTDGASAYSAADRMREAIGAADGSGVRVTASAGVCDIASAATAADLYRLADGALYWAKAHGRDATFLYSVDVVEELSASERAERLERLLTIGTVRALARAVDAKDRSTHQHSERVGELARRIARELGWAQRDATALYEAGLVHDVGKIGVPDAILFKAGPLDPVEFAQIRAHSALGAQMVTGVLGEEQVRWVRWHHERMDGSGYPDGLAGDEIPEGARILALADAWDAMTSERPYCTPLGIEEALAECRSHAGRQFWEPAIDAIEELVAADRLPNSGQWRREHPALSA